MNKFVKYEVCCGCTEDVLQAAKGGADRVELNSALFLGGLTPSLGTLIAVKRQTNIPVMAMVRPREGGFCYTEAEYDTMKEDARLLLCHGAEGLVFGFLLPDGTIDRRRTTEFVELCGDREAVFSRAVDVCPNMLEGMEMLSQLGVKRVLTSGGEPSAFAGAGQIAMLQKEVGQRLEILPGGGINPENVEELVARTGVNQVHSSARRLFYDTSVRQNPQIFFGGSIEGKFLPEDEYKVTDARQVAKMKAVLAKIGSKV